MGSCLVFVVCKVKLFNGLHLPLQTRDGSSKTDKCILHFTFYILYSVFCILLMLGVFRCCGVVALCCGGAVLRCHGGRCAIIHAANWQWGTRCFMFHCHNERL